MRIYYFITYLIVVFITGCTDEHKIEPSIKIYKDLGSLQCGGGSIFPPDVMKKQLVSSGVQVRSYSCGLDGLIHPYMCGIPDGRINIFEIEQNNLSQSQSLGFKDLSTLPNATETQCL